MHREVKILAPAGELFGDLTLPALPRGLVLFAHGSGSSRHSTRNQSVARFLQQSALGTLLFDLLTEREEEIDRRTRELRFDIKLLAERLALVSKWVKAQPETSRLPLGYFGASTGAAAALIAATGLPGTVGAVVSRGGRADLAGDSLQRVAAPTLLIVGQHDEEVLELNERALQSMRAEKKLIVIPRAGHLFEEHGALELVARAARDWFIEHLAGEKRESRGGGHALS